MPLESVDIATNASEYGLTSYSGSADSSNYTIEPESSSFLSNSVVDLDSLMENPICDLDDPHDDSYRSDIDDDSDRSDIDDDETNITAFEHFDLEDDFVPVEDDEEWSELQDESSKYNFDRSSEYPKRSHKLHNWPAIPTVSNVAQLSRDRIYASEWIAQCNQQYTVPDKDPCVMNFRENFATMISNICKWADVEGRQTLRFDRGNRAMAAGFINLLLYNDSSYLTEACMQSMPLIVQHILGSPQLSLEDFLDLPCPSPCFYHRATYADVACCLQKSDIIMGPSNLTIGLKMVKTMSEGARTRLYDAMLYIGSSNGKNGARMRLLQHETVANSPAPSPTTSGRHYQRIRQPSVATNFRILSVWQNMDIIADQDHEDRMNWGPVLMEGLLMAYLDTVNPPSNYSRHNSSYLLDLSLPPAVIDSIRTSNMPSFRAASLNSAWPLQQGMRGEIRSVRECSFCKRLWHPLGWRSGNFEAIRVLLRVRCEGPPKWSCERCVRYAERHDNKLPTLRQRINEGGIYMPFHINRAWLHNHPERRRCCNENCGVFIPSDASLYGLEARIRCKRCDRFVQNNRKEWPSESLETLSYVCDEFKCADCSSMTTQAHRWGTELVCTACNATRCCPENHKSGSRNKETVLTCSVSGCTSTRTYQRMMKHLIQDIKLHVWRCLPCDYHYSMYKKEFPHGKNESLPEPKQISHHRYNLIQCCKCRHYASPGNWIDSGNDTFTCTLCMASCSTEGCSEDPTRYPIKWNKIAGQWQCQVCFDWPLAKKSNTSSATQRIIRNTAERKCRNARCGEPIPADTCFRYAPGQGDREEGIRCGRCYKYLYRHSEE